VPTVLRDRVSQILGCQNVTSLLPLSNASCAEQLSGTQIELKYSFTRQGPESNNPIQGTVYLNEADLPRDEALQLSQVLNSTNAASTFFECPTPYKQWLRLQAAQGDVSAFRIAQNPESKINLSLITNDQFESYWSVSSTANDSNIRYVLISDNFVSSSLLALTGVSSYSVVGFYVIVVYTFAQLLRLLYGDQVKQIIFQDLQNVDYILRIVTAVKLARTQRHYYLEESLYRKLIRIYRDPALIVKLSKRLKEEEADKLAFDGNRDTSFNDPNRFGWGIRHRTTNQNDAEEEEENEMTFPIESNIKKNA